MTSLGAAAMATTTKPGVGTGSDAPIRLLLLVGTETGNAELVADAIETELASPQLDISTVVEGARLVDLDRCNAVLVCTSSHSAGDIPDNFLPFCEALERDAPDLSRIVFGVIALGDSSYAETFCGAGKKVDRLFDRLRARCVEPRLEIDANEHPIPDALAVDWTRAWVAKLIDALRSGPESRPEADMTK